MNDADGSGFLSRWSRRKRQTQASTGPIRPFGIGEADIRDAPPRSGPPAAAPEDPPLDVLAELPSVESLTADSDFTLFLRKGVPRALRTAALRKLWLSDPAIRNYKTLADYDWDFNAPGYGALLPTDDIRTLVDAILKPRDIGTAAGDLRDPDADFPTGADRLARADAAAPVEEDASVSLPPQPEPAPVQEEARRDDGDPGSSGTHSRRRRHGGALPT